MNADQKWVSRHFGELVDLYGGRTVAVVRGRVVAVGSDAEAVETRARAACPSRNSPAVVRLPGKEIWHGFRPLRLRRFS
jgi:hypothetical protein